MLPKIQIFLPPEEMPLLYLSENRTSSVEDCIHFFPSLFRLFKSIIVAEPVSTATIPGYDEATAAIDMTQDLSFTLKSTFNIGSKNLNPDIMQKLYTDAK